MTDIPMKFFSENVDSWGASEWFGRLADAIREQDKAAIAKDEISFETYRMIAASSAMTLVRDHEATVRSALSAALSRPIDPKAEVEPVAWMPIESAPKDCSSVIIAVPTEDRDGFIIGEAYFDPAHHEGGDWWWAGTAHGNWPDSPISEINHHQPEFWQPLPPEPGSASPSIVAPVGVPMAWAYNIEGYGRHVWFEKPSQTSKVTGLTPLYASEPKDKADVSVKPLEWKEEGGEYIAQSVIGWFHIGRQASSWNLTTPHGKVASFETLEEAKEAAQYDYEVRIFSALSPSPVAEASVPDGWQLVPMKPTQEMLDAVTAADQQEPFSDETMRGIFVDMLAAAPALTPAEKAGVGDGDAEADRRKHVGQGMAIAAAIIVRVWGDDTQAKEILGAAGYNSVADLKRDEIDDYDIEPLAPLLAEQGDGDPLTCPICAEVINEGDLCATDIEMGTCHAACLDGAAIVDLDTGEPTDSPISTFTYEADQP